MSSGTVHSQFRSEAAFDNPAGWNWAVRSPGAFFGVLLLIASVNVTMFEFHQQREGDAFRIDSLMLVRFAACALFGLYGFIYLPRTISQFFCFPAAWNTILVLWAGIAVPFSVSPMFSAAGVFTLICVTLFVPAVLAELGGTATVKVLFSGLLIFVGLNWFVSFVAPNLVDTSSETVGGGTLHRFGNDPQQLGLQVVWALGFLLVLAFGKARTWRSTCVWLVVLLATLALTLSRTAIVASVAVVAAVTWVHFTGRLRIMAIACACLMIGVAMIASASGLLASNSDAVASTISRSGDIDELRTFTGRVEIWRYSWRKCLESPLVGYGYGGSRYVLQEDPSYPLKFQANHAHNLFLNMALTTGLPGALLLATMVAQLLLMNLRRPSPVPSLALALVITASITESLLYSSMPRSHMILWLVALFWQQMGMDVERRDLELNGGER